MLKAWRPAAVLVVVRVASARHDLRRRLLRDPRRVPLRSLRHRQVVAHEEARAHRDGDAEKVGVERRRTEVEEWAVVEAREARAASAPVTAHADQPRAAASVAAARRVVQHPEQVPGRLARQWHGALNTLSVVGAVDARELA